MAVCIVDVAFVSHLVATCLSSNPIGVLAVLAMLVSGVSRLQKLVGPINISSLMQSNFRDSLKPVSQ